MGYSVKADEQKATEESIVKEDDPLNKKDTDGNSTIDSDKDKLKESKDNKLEKGNKENLEKEDNKETDKKEQDNKDQKEEKSKEDPKKEQEKSDLDLMIENNTRAKDDDGDEDGEGEEGAAQGNGKYVKPSPRPLKSLGMIIRSGFFVQPSKHYYVKTGKSVIIKSRYRESIWNRLSGLLILKDPTPNYRWRYSEDMVHWLRFKKKVCHTKNYEFKAKKTGDYYMQSRASSAVLLTLGRLYYYSEIANVHVVDEPKDAINLKVETDEDYLYNLEDLDNITNAHEIVAPKDASGIVRWSGDNSSLATIDPISG